MNRPHRFNICVKVVPIELNDSFKDVSVTFCVRVSFLQLNNNNNNTERDVGKGSQLC